MNNPYIHRCDQCGEHWWDAHVCPDKIQAALPPKQPYAYTGPLPDCRTCSHYRYSDRVDCCADICKDADRYDPLPPVRLWKKT